MLGVVLEPPTLEHHAGVSEAPELLTAEALVAQAVVEALGEGVLPGLAGLDVEGFGAQLRKSLGELEGDELRPLSERITRGRPWRANRRASTPLAAAEVSERPGTMASATRVNSSSTVSTLRRLPPAVASKMKS